MLGPLSPGHAKAVLDLLLQGPADCVMVSPCGGRVEVASLLLALHSPVMATLLKEGGKGISLPVPINEIRALVKILQGRNQEQEVQEEVAQLLGIRLLEKKVFSSSNIKTKKGIAKLKSDQKIKMRDVAELFSKVTPRKIVDTKVELEMDPVFSNTALVSTEINAFKNTDKDVANMPLIAQKRGEEKSTNRAFRKHKAKTIPRRKIECDQCLSCFKTKNGLKRHKLKRHEIPMNCEKCSDTFLSSISYNEHMRKNHPSNICPKCGVAKLSKATLQSHIESAHQDDISCPICGHMLKSNTALKGHINRLHSNNETEKCSKCDYQPPSKVELNAHFKKKHTDANKATCQYCGEVFKGLKEHLQRTGCGGEIIKADKIPCSRCIKKFSTKLALGRHVREIHTGVKDKKCEKCSYATFSGFNLRLHISKVHLGKKELDKEKCLYCNKVTTNLSYHMEIMHNNHFVKTKN